MNLSDRDANIGKLKEQNATLEQKLQQSLSEAKQLKGRLERNRAAAKTSPTFDRKARSAVQFLREQKLESDFKSIAGSSLLEGAPVSNYPREVVIKLLSSNLLEKSDDIIDGSNLTLTSLGNLVYKYFVESGRM
jgi:hypothetical protein